VIQYEAAVKADSFLVMAHGTPAEMARAEAILSPTSPFRLDVHADVKAESRRIISSMRWLNEAAMMVSRGRTRNAIRMVR
jgi:ABC-type sulfate/molybdate transport systems ATPase subunit